MLLLDKRKVIRLFIDSYALLPADAAPQVLSFVCEARSCLFQFPTLTNVSGFQARHAYDVLQPADMSLRSCKL